MWRDAFPCKLKKIYILNLPSVLALTLKSAKSCLSQKIQDRISIEGPKATTMFEDIVRDQIPEALGGSKPFNWQKEVDVILGTSAPKS